MTQVYAKTINITNETYQNNTDIISVDLNNCNVVNDSLVNAFNGCSNLDSVYNINNNVYNIWSAFNSCTYLVNAPIIPNSVNTMWRTFDNSYKLTGDIIIHSNQITNAIDCFNNTSLDKNVYIPFTYQNGDNTLTYNSFINAGYGTDPSNRVNGVCLYDLATYQN